MKKFILALLLLWAAPVFGATVTIGNNTADTFSGTEDTSIRSLQATTNFGSVGVDVSKYAPGDINNGLFRFTGLTNITGPVTVSSATLFLYMESGSASADTFDVRPSLRAWSQSQATWNIYSTGNSWTTAGGLGNGTDRSMPVATGTTATSNGYVAFTGSGLATLVADWINGTTVNNGVFLERNGSGNDGNYKVFTAVEGTQGQRPYLSVTYTLAAADTTPPSTPTNLAATALSSSSIGLTWTTSTDNIGVQSYSVERCQGSSCSNFVAVGSSSINSFTDTGLSSGTPYRYRIRAFDGTNFSTSYSSIVSASTLAVRTATLSWVDSVNTDHTGYTIQRKTLSTGTYADIATVGAGVRSYVDVNSPQTVGCYRLRADRSGEMGPFSSPDACTSGVAQQTQKQFTFSSP